MPSPGYLPDPGIELGSPELQVDSLPTELLRKLSLTRWGSTKGLSKNPANAGFQREGTTRDDVDLLLTCTLLKLFFFSEKLGPRQRGKFA